jgi:hypothetical protein
VKSACEYRLLFCDVEFARALLYSGLEANGDPESRRDGVAEACC